MKQKETAPATSSKGKRLSVLLVFAVAVIGVAALVAALAADPDAMPWEKGGKQPSEYTWEEFQALEGIQKDHFYESFGSAEAFEAWMNEAGAPAWEDTEPVVAVPWEENGAKQPDAYTWKEYQSLTQEQRERFVDSFASIDDFENWLNVANPPEETEPAGQTEPTAQTEPSLGLTKEPGDYTWEDYQSLSPEQKDAFFESFASADDFAAWMQRVRPADADSGDYPWETVGKPIDRYTWEEFLALTPELQEAFFESFHSPNDFEAWMNRVKPR